jgi:hypothetical protein
MTLSAGLQGFYTNLLHRVQYTVLCSPTAGLFNLDLDQLSLYEVVEQMKQGLTGELITICMRTVQYEVGCQPTSRFSRAPGHMPLDALLVQLHDAAVAQGGTNVPDCHYNFFDGIISYA